jgi:hypothetical protein
MTLAEIQARSSFRNGPAKTLATVVAGVALALTLVLVAFAIANYVRTGDGIGGDFLTDYAGGHLVWSGRGDQLYDLDAQERAQRSASPAGEADDVNPFIAPPAVAWAFAPLSAVPYVPAHLMFTALNLLALAGALALLRRELREAPAAAAYTLLAVFALSMPAVTNITWGQIDLIIVYAFLLGWRATRGGNEVVAGSAFALLALKPYFLLGIIPLLVLQRRWSALAAFAAVALPLTAVPALALGSEAMGDYVNLLTGATEMPASMDTQPQHMANVRGLMNTVSGGDDMALWLPALALLAATSLALALRSWGRDLHSPRSYALAAMLPLLASPHVHMQSLMALFVAIAVVVGSERADELRLPLGGRNVDTAAALLCLGTALFVGWFLTANGVAVMVLISSGVFIWCATAPPETAAKPLARHAPSELAA